MRRSIAGMLLALWLTALAGGACSRLGGDEAALALEDMAAGAGPSRLKQRTPAPARETLTYLIDGRHRRADVYRPAEGALAGILLVPGVVPEAKDDPRVVNIARTLARLRFAVLVPEIPGLRRLQVGTGDIVAVEDAFRHLASRPDLAPAGRAGMAGFSYGAGPMLLAAAGLGERVRFVLAVGGYHDLRRLVTYFTTGHYPGAADLRPPNPYIKWVYARSNAELLHRPADRQALAAHAQAVLEGRTPPPLPPSLGADARALHALLTNADPERVPALLAGLPERLRRELDGLNPAARDLAGLTAEVILVHGRRDDMIPYPESQALAAALRPGQARLFLIDGLIHVDLQLREHDLPVLLRALQALLAQRGEAPGP